MSDLVAWLTQLWDYEESVAKNARDEAPRLSWEEEKVYDGVYSLDLGPATHPDSDSYDVGADCRIPREIAHHIARHNPEAVLARIAADRQILALHSFHMVASLDSHLQPIRDSKRPRCDTCASQDENGEDWPCATVRLLAQPYADRPGYNPEWKP